MLRFAAACLLGTFAMDDYIVTARRKDDVVSVTSLKDGVVVDVKSPFGISQATIVRKADVWPKSVVVRLRLKGLESFKISNGKTELAGAVGIVDGKPNVRLCQDRNEGEPLDEKNPLWVRVAIVEEKMPALPLKTGAFELTLPAALFEGEPKAISVRWIDFYR